MMDSHSSQNKDEIDENAENENHLNINELVGKLLSGQGLEVNVENHQNDLHEQHRNVPDGDIELPDINADVEDIVAQVSRSLQESEPPLPHNHPNLNNLDQNNFDQLVEDDERQHREWAQILQQGLLQEEQINEEPPSTNTSNMAQKSTTTDTHVPDTAIGDQRPTEFDDDDDDNDDDEGLRLAILESLQQLEGASHSTTKKSHSTKGTTKNHSKHATSTKSSKKKSSKKSTGRSRNNTDNDSMDFSEVIRKITDQHELESEQPSGIQTTNDDHDTHALVESTLKAFERELLGVNYTEQSEELSNSSLLDKHKKTDITKRSKYFKNDSSKKVESERKKKKKKSSNKEKDKHKRKSKTTVVRETPKLDQNKDMDDNDFSKVLADMVQQVVTSTLEGKPPSQSYANEQIKRGKYKAKQPKPSTVSKTNKSQSEDALTDKNFKENLATDANDDVFDLNQIMKNAMAMAFQDQENQHLNKDALEEFSRGLNDLSLDRSSSSKKSHLSKQKKSTSKKKLKRAVDDKNKAASVADETQTLKVQDQPTKKLSEDELRRKAYFQIVTEAATICRRRRIERNKALRSKIKEERQKVREARKLRKKEEAERLEKEQQELKAIVEKGPPYPADLKLTKSGKPKKPYRRMTPEEISKKEAQLREQMAANEIRLREKHERKAERAKQNQKRDSSRKLLQKITLIPTRILRRLPFYANWERESNGHKDDEDFLNYLKRENNDLSITRTVKAILSDKAIMTMYDPNVKTVIKREKIPFHPPWNIPCFPPLRLPQARKKKKEKTYEAKAIRKPRLSKELNMVFPALLVPLINHLKAAAKAKASTAATPEEASKYLATIINHSKNSISRALLLALKGSKKVVPIEVKKESNSAIHEKPLTKIPIFNSVKSQSPFLPSNTAIPLNNNINIKNSVKLEKEPNQFELEGKSKADSIPSVSLKENDHDDSDELSMNKLVDEPVNADETLEISEKSPTQPMENPQIGGVNNLVSIGTENVKEKVRARTASKIEIINIDSSDKTEEPNRTFADAEINTRESIPSTKPSQNYSESAETREILAYPVTETFNDTLRTENTLNIHTTTFNKPSVDSIDLSKKNLPKNIHEVVDYYVRKQLDTEETDEKLPPNISKIITSTITELLPKKKRKEAPNKQKEVERPNKRPNPNKILNLDGIIPPSFVPKNSPPDKQDKVTITEHNAKFDFAVPDLSNYGPLRTFVYKRIKSALSSDELVTFRKEINKERKRRWRSVNTSRNRETNIRTNVKRRANRMFGSGDSQEKEEWCKREFQMKMEQLQLKIEGKEETPNDELKNQTFSDNDMLNIFASTFDRLDVARDIEKEALEIIKLKNMETIDLT